MNDYFTGEEIKLNEYKDDLMFIEKLNRNNEKRLCSCRFAGVSHNRKYNCDVILFADDFRKLYIEMLFIKGELYISEPYGMTADRSEMEFVMKIL